MQKAGHPNNLARRLRTIAVVAGLVAGGLGAFAPAASAQGTDTPKPAAVHGDGLPSIPRPIDGKPTTLPQPRTGSYGPAFAARTSATTVSPNVEGGTLANSADYPGIVGVWTWFIGGWNSDGSAQWYVSTCTGTVVSPTKILTAAHCVVGKFYGTTYVIAGRNKLMDTTSGYVAAVATTWTDQSYNIKQRTNNPDLVPTHDVSVLTLTRPLPAAYPPVQLAAQGDSTPYAANTAADVIGYGFTGPTTPTSTTDDEGVLYKATVQIQSDSTCQTLTGYDKTTMTCATTPTVGTAVAACIGDAGGPLMVATAGGTVEAGIVDWGTDCSVPNLYNVFERLSYYNTAVNLAVARHGLVNLDWTGDGHSDLFTRDAYGDLRIYSGSGFVDDGNSGFAGVAGLGTVNWNAYNKLFRVTDWNNDGNESIMARDPSGRLWQYKGDGAGSYDSAAVQVGTGWGWFADIMVTNNWTGDGHPNILGRTSTGDLYLYTSDGNGGWENGGTGIKIGTAWNWFNTVLTPGDWKGDGHQALIGRTPGGDLYLYQSDGKGGWTNGGAGVKIGTAWNWFNTFMSPGDWNGDETVDLLGITPGGDMYLYTTDGKGSWLTGVGQKIGAGWNVFNLVY